MPKIILFVTDKQFGKNFIDYRIINNETGEEEKGKCGNHAYISKLFFGLRDEHGEENVRMLSR